MQSRPARRGPEGFRDPPGNPERGGSFPDRADFFRWRLGRRDPPPGPPAGRVRPKRGVLAALAGTQGANGLARLGHASFPIRLAGRTVLVDPFLAEHASPMSPSGPRRFASTALSPSRLPTVDLVLLTHNHHDHLDRPTLEPVAARHRPLLVTTLGVSAYLADLPFRAVHELDWYDRIELPGLEVAAVPAIRFSERTLLDRNRSLGRGFRITDGRCVLRTLGDTASGPVFAELARRWAPPDRLLLAIGADEPRELTKAAHCTPEEAVAIDRTLGARRLVAVHRGTIARADEPPLEPPLRFREAAAEAGCAPDRDALVPAIGETLPLA